MTIKYHLIYCFGQGKENIYNPSLETIDWAIERLIPEEDYFVVYEHIFPVRECKFIQTLMTSDEDEGRYRIETRFENNDEDWTQFATYVSGIAEVKKIFHGFASGVVPNINGWNDITEEIKAKNTQ